MNVKRALLGVVVGLALIATVGAVSGAAAADDQVLTAGTYTANVKAIVCGGCGSLIKKTIEALKPIQSATVNQDAKTVEFVVKKDNSIKLSEVQTALKAAAGKMGMGADYTLSNVKAKP